MDGISTIQGSETTKGKERPGSQLRWDSIGLFGTCVSLMSTKVNKSLKYTKLDDVSTKRPNGVVTKLRLSPYSSFCLIPWHGIGL